MKALILAESERLFKRKLTWVVLAMAPIGLFVAASYLQKQNGQISSSLPEYTVTGNFAVLGLAEMLFTAFNALLLVFITLMITEEYRTGQLRMVMIRARSMGELVVAKTIVLLGFLLLFYIVYFLSSYVIGFLLFDNPAQYPVFHHKELVSFKEGFFYNVMFYSWAYVTTVAVGAVLVFIAVISKTTTTAIGGGIGFLLLSFSCPYVLKVFSPWMDPIIFAKMFFMSVPMIQLEGITTMIAEKPQFILWNTGVLCFYILFFGTLTFLTLRKKETFL
jgi:ABC-type transport system involved in multi-copper enzyme maturation permease subunit